MIMNQNMAKLYVAAMVPVAVIGVLTFVEVGTGFSIALALLSVLIIFWMVIKCKDLFGNNEDLKSDLMDLVKSAEAQKNHVAQLETKLAEQNKIISDLLLALQKAEKFSEIPFISDIPTLKERISVLGDFLVSVVPSTQVDSYKNLFAKFESYEEMIRTLKIIDDQMTQPLFSSMENKSVAMDEPDIKMLLEQLIMLALCAVELGKAADANGITDKHLNLKVLLGDISQEEALERAVPITDYPEETPAWIRSFKKLLMYLDVQDDKSIYVGYKL